MKAHEYEERTAELFQPDTLLPSQYFDRIRKQRHFDGERRLMIAVLEDAVDVYRKQAAARDPRGRGLFRDAEEWIEDTEKGWLYSFENICDVLDLDPDYLRRGLHQWKERAGRAKRSEVVTLCASEPAVLLKASGD